MDEDKNIIGKRGVRTTFGADAEKPRPTESTEAFLSVKELFPMIMDATDTVAQIAEALSRIAEGVERLGPKEEVKEEPPPAPKEWCSVEETGKELNRSPYQIRDLCRRKVFGQKDSGGKWWIHRKDIENFRNGRTLIHGEVF